jgi:predicted NBD/HSP70 family sugar kinase
MTKYLWGIDLGGTKIEGVILEADSFECRLRKRIPTERDKGYGHIVARVAELIGLMEAESGILRPERIGLGTPGVTDPDTGLIKNANTVCLIDQPLVQDISTALSTRVDAANDANCFALAEAQLGAAKGFDVVFGVILGTGVGGGVVVHNKVLGGRHGIAGEWGHNVLDPNGKGCYCGKKGCVETVLSGPSLERAYFELTGDLLFLPQIEERAREGDSRAFDFLVENGKKLGQALSVVVNILDPDAVVLGGGVGNSNLLYEWGRKSLDQWIFSNRGFEGALLRPELGDSAGVYGAAMLTA